MGISERIVRPNSLSATGDYPKKCKRRKNRRLSTRRNLLTINWLPRIDSNYDKMIQNHLCYRYTTRQ